MVKIADLAEIRQILNNFADLCIEKKREKDYLVTLKTTEFLPLGHAVDIIENALLNPIQSRPLKI